MVLPDELVRELCGDEWDAVLADVDVEAIVRQQTQTQQQTEPQQQQEQQPVSQAVRSSSDADWECAALAWTGAGF